MAMEIMLSSCLIISRRRFNKNKRNLDTKVAGTYPGLKFLPRLLPSFLKLFGPNFEVRCEHFLSFLISSNMGWHQRDKTKTAVLLESIFVVAGAGGCDLA